MDAIVDAARKALHSQSANLIEAYLDRATRIERFAHYANMVGQDRLDAANREFAALVDYLERWTLDGDQDFRALYLGERSKLAFDVGQSGDERRQRLHQFLDEDANALDAVLGAAGSAPAALLRDLASSFEKAASKEVKALFVGDCLHLDVIGFLSESLARRDVSMTPHFVTDKNPIQAAKAIRALGDQSFDVIFYSPFTYEASNAFLGLLNWRGITMSRSKKADLREETLRDARMVGEAIAETFACPVFIHNSAAIVRRAHSSKKDIALRFSSGARAALRTEIDKGVDQLVADLNQATFPHVLKFDELRYLEDATEIHLSEHLYKSSLQHPARLGAYIARDYEMILETTAHLLKKKMVVCDLDNTLWDGIIGEGAVDHFEDRQTVLKELKAKGVVLSIASKNDPANVHWRGGVLCDDDFVYSAISWGPKIAAFEAMEKDLNLKRKDFVFVDDRADERAMASERYPEIRSVDAMDQRTWDCFGLWRDMLMAGSEMDRTKMYQDRREREKFTATSDVAADEAAMFGALELKLTMWEAQRGDLPRVAELINRTNQFNMTGLRTTLPEVTDMSSGNSHQIMVASMEDRFGEMGVISVLLANFGDQDKVEIEAFVLSCRVFGYQAEGAMLNEVKRQAKAAGKSQIRGACLHTAVNGPCQNVYAENGFHQSGDFWTHDLSDQSEIDPEWLKVVVRA